MERSATAIILPKFFLVLADLASLANKYAVTKTIQIIKIMAAASITYPPEKARSCYL